MDTPHQWLNRLARAVNDHDLETVAGAFAEDYRNETPAHPARGFAGRDQVRTNWGRMFAAIPDLTADVSAHVVDGDTVWSEWEMRGTRPDGQPHHLRGVVVFRLEGQEAVAGRFYLEPVDLDPSGVDAAVDRVVRDGSAP